MLRKLIAPKPDRPSAGKQTRARAEPPVLDTAVAGKAFARDVPDAGYAKARREFYEAFGGPVVERSRYFVLCVVMGLVIAGQSAAIMAMLPLKTIQPWVVKVDDTRGTVALDKGAAVPANAYTPGRAVLERELFDFVQQLWSINAEYSTLTKDGHSAAFARTRERAIEEFKEFLTKERVYARIKTEQGLVRSVTRKSVAFRAEQGIAHVRFATVERSRENQEGTRREWTMLVQFAQRELSNAEEIERNPLGLFITHFEFNEER